MTKIQRSWDLLTAEERKTMIEEIITFFQNERNEEIGYIAAETLLDFFLEKTALPLYNKGVESTVHALADRIPSWLLDLETDAKR